MILNTSWEPTYFPVYENSYGTKEEYQEGRFIKIEGTL
jgi:hypothetical protein